MERQAGGLIQAIELVVIGGVWAQVVVTLLDDHMAGGAGAASSAGMFDMNAEVEGDV